MDSQEKSHEVTWKSLLLEKLIELKQQNEMEQRIMQKRSQRRLRTTIKEISDGFNQDIEELQKSVLNFFLPGRKNERVIW